MRGVMLVINWSNLGKKRSRFGQWLDNRGLTQEQMSNMSGVSQRTLGDLANNDNKIPSYDTRKKIMDVINVIDKEKNSRYFWNWKPYN